MVSAYTASNFIVSVASLVVPVDTVCDNSLLVCCQSTNVGCEGRITGTTLWQYRLQTETAA